MDIALCANSECGLYEQCYRNHNKHEIGYWQSYVSPKANENGCDLFWEDKPYDKSSSKPITKGFKLI